jgi:protein TonB
MNYLDADPEDHIGIRSLFSHNGRPPVGAEDWQKDKGFVVPTIANHVAPDYPDVARQARIEGWVVVLARIRKDGSVGSAHAVSSSNPMFEESATNATLKSKFTPATRGGEPIEVAWPVTVEFHLN